MPETQERRELEFATLDDAVAHARRLHGAGYDRLGQWSLGQCCRHLAEFTTFSLDGFPMRHLPWPVTAITRRLFLNEKKLQKPLPAGMPAPKEIVPPRDSDDAEAVAAFAEACGRFDARLAEGAALARSPLFGELSPEMWHRLHRKHAGHHLSFLVPRDA